MGIIIHQIMNNKQIRIVALLVAFVFSCQSPQTESNDLSQMTNDSSFVQEELGPYVKSGDYYELYIGIDKNKYLTAYYQSKYTDPSCSFFIHGPLKNKSSFIAYDPYTNSPPVEAVFSFFGDELLLKIRGAENRACDAQLFDQVGYPIVLDLQKEWQQIRILKNEAKLLLSPDSAIVLEFLKKHQIVGVLNEDESWMQVEGIDRKSNTGWIEKRFVEPILE